MARLHITDAGGRQWECPLTPQSVCTIGRAPDNCVTLDDPRASRYHAHIKYRDGAYVIVDGRVTGPLIQRSSNQVLVNGRPFHEHVLKDGEQITIGASLLCFAQSQEEVMPLFGSDEQRLGHTQVTVKVKELLQARHPTGGGVAPAQEELATLRRKADILALLYEMSRTLGSVFAPLLRADFCTKYRITFVYSIQEKEIDRIDRMHKSQHRNTSGFRWWLSASSRQSCESCQIVFLKVYRCL